MDTSVNTPVEQKKVPFMERPLKIKWFITYLVITILANFFGGMAAAGL